MAIKRCPYCRSIIDEKDQFCGNCGTQLLFPEDEFIEEQIPGEKPADVDEPAKDAGGEEEITFEEPSPAAQAHSATALGFPPSLTEEPPPKKRGRKSRKDDESEPAAPPEPDRVFKTSELPEMGRVGDTGAVGSRTSAEMLFEEAFPSKPKPSDTAKPAAKAQAPSLSATRSPAATTTTSPRSTTTSLKSTASGTREEPSLDASAEEIEEIARMMSSLDKDPKVAPASATHAETPAPPEPPARTAPPAPPAPPEPKVEHDMSLGDTAFYAKRIEDIRQETLHGPGRDRKSDSSELRKSAADVPPWATGLRVESPLEKLDIPGLKDTKSEPPALERSAGLTDILNKLEQEPAASTQDEEEFETGPVAPGARETGEPDQGPTDWADIPGRIGRDTSETGEMETISDRLGRERRASSVSRDRPMARRVTARSGSKAKAKLYDVLLILVGWVVAVVLATRILSVSVMEIFDAAAVPLVLFLVTLGVAYFFLFLFFLGETLGDRLASS